MSAVTRPRGPLPARVYWARRLVVLGACFALVLGLGRLLGGASDARSSASGTATQVGATVTRTPRTDPSSTAAARPERARDRPAGRKRARAEDPLPAPDGPCAPTDLQVVPLVERADADDAIRIRFEVRGTEPACTWTASPESLAVKITSGDDLIWTSQHCPKVVPTRDVVVRDRKPARIALTWNGRRSDEECSTLTTWALPGWYHVVSAPLGGEPVDRQFELRRPPAETVTRTAEPEPRRKKDRDRARDESRPTDEPLDGQRDGSREPAG